MPTAMLLRRAMRSSAVAAARPHLPETLVPARGFFDIHKFVNKEAIAKEKARINDELSRGYFADMHEFNKHGGKIAMANKTIIPSAVAAKFPDLEVMTCNSKSLKLPVVSGQNGSELTIPSATLLCLSFRASSQAMTESWSAPFLNSFKASGQVQCYELSVVDSWLLSLGPIKWLMIRIMKKSNDPQKQILYSFGDHYEFRKKLHILNLLTGYAFLLDRAGRIRWQGFGLATEEEISYLVSSTSTLLDEK